MNPVLQDFIPDLQRLRRMIDLSSQLRSFPSIEINPTGIQEEIVKNAGDQTSRLGRRITLRYPDTEWCSSSLSCGQV